MTLKTKDEKEKKKKDVPLQNIFLKTEFFVRS